MLHLVNIRCTNTIRAGLFTKPDIYGHDPYNSLEPLPRSIPAGGGYHGPLGAIAYRSHKAWDFFKGTDAQRIAAWSAGQLRIGRYA